ncbi:putative cyclic phosphodiesterase [Naviculisporaceae sp. PSN 640]
MPGSSLWLLPPKSHPLHSILTTLITSTLPSLFPEIIPPSSTENASELHGMDSSVFPPHMTITSSVCPSLYGSDPQGWLDSLPFPATGSPNGVKVRFHATATGSGDEAKDVKGSIQSQDTFFRRCFIKVVLDESVRRLAGIARAKAVNGEDSEAGPKTQEWLASWAKKFGPHVSLIYGNVPIDEETLAKISEVVEQAGVGLGRSGATDGHGPDRHNGWDGGVVWLVPTDGPVNQWKPIAIREL